MLQDSFTTARPTCGPRAGRGRVDADRMLLATRSALDADGDLLEPPERARHRGLMQPLCDTAANRH
jgi:molecular chaperone HscA